jgi:PIN domain
MTTTFVLIDYENVQPTELSLLRGDRFKVKLFLGPNQAKIPVALAAALHALGPNAEYVLLESRGSNALDFHIAYYIGVLSGQEPAAQFHIISKDTGFDPLIKHLKLRGVIAQRFPSIASIPTAKVAAFLADDDQLQTAIAHLGKLKMAKPRTERTLRSTLHALFKRELSEERLTALLATLCDRGVVKIVGTKVTYDVPAAP